MGTYQDAKFYNDESWMGKGYYSPPFVRGYTFAWVRRFRQVAKVLAPDEEILDLGCGSGILAAFLWHKIEHRARFMGIDFNEPMIEKAREGNEAEGHQNAKFYVKSATDLPVILKGFWPDSLPTIVTAEMLEHVEDDRAIVESIPSGIRCVITVPCHDDPAHVRWFPKIEDITKRYGEFFDGLKVQQFMSDFSGKLRRYQYDNICVGIRK